MIYDTQIIYLRGGVEHLRNKKFILVRPVSSKKQKLFQWFSQVLKERGIVTESIEFAKIRNYIDYADFILVVDEDEKRAVDTLGRDIERYICKDDMTVIIGTYMWFVNTQMRFECYEPFWDYLRKLNTSGVFVLNLLWRENEYANVIKKQIYDKFASIGKTVKQKLYHEFYPGFFDDLYTEEYAEQILKMPFRVESVSGKLKDCCSSYLNVTNGERYTEGQPNSYTKTIWFFGPCYIYGARTEDKNTVESFLQRHLNEMGYGIRVVNCGSPAYLDLGKEFASMLCTPFRKGDIVVVDAKNHSFDDIANLNMFDIVEQKKINPNWLLDTVKHCNHKVNALYADAIFDALQPILSETPAKQGELIEQDRDFVKAVYLDKYFADFAPAQYGKIGAIVMNCNPFTYGHRYLIEQALKTVDFLILFVVEEDKSVFSFHERFAMVCAGVSDLANVKVVPSGPFILSQTSFPEYFIKEADEDLAENVENDVTFFAERIAPHLNITYRFVGEEPEDKVTNEYNAAMKRILPAHGITLVELPRKETNGGYISASRVRQCLEDNDVDGLAELIPQSTREILFGE